METFACDSIDLSTIDEKPGLNMFSGLFGSRLPLLEIQGFNLFKVHNNSAIWLPLDRDFV